jgi:ferredoxin
VLCHQEDAGFRCLPLGKVAFAVQKCGQTRHAFGQGQPGKLDPAKEQAFEVHLKDSGLLLQVPRDRTLLEALRAANIDVQSDCGEGLCGSCEVPVLAGEVDHRDVVLTRAERERNNKMMACCSRARCGRLELQL